MYSYNNSKWTEIELKKLKMWAGNIPIPFIADQLDRSYSSVYNKIRKSGMKGRVKGFSNDKIVFFTWPEDIPKDVV